MTKNHQPQDISTAVTILKRGGVIAYPTEAVFGLGCDPFNIDAITRILQIKRRALNKGFILIASSWKQVENLTQPISPMALSQVLATWPGPVTWVFPVASDVPEWITGDHGNIALRITDHPVAKALCEEFGGPIISTSANATGFPPVRDLRTLQMTELIDEIDAVVAGEVGRLTNPTSIRDAITGEVLR